MQTSKKYIKQSNLFRVPTTDNKLIEEYFGRESSGHDAFSGHREDA